MGSLVGLTAAVLLSLFSHVYADYQLVPGKYNFMSALHACSDLGEEWFLPDGQALGTGLVEVLNKNGITSVWLSVFRRTFVKWQWVDGVPDSSFDTNTRHEYCAMLKLTAQILPTTCISQGVGLVCQIPETVPCPQHYSCFRMNHTKNFIDCTLTDWYGARSICSNYGGDLVILDEKWKVQEVADQLAQMDRSLHCQKVFVGLHRENWLAVNPQDEGQVLFTTKWGLGEPSPLHHRRCVEAVKNSRGLEAWKAKSCLEKTNVICYKENMKLQPSVKGIVATTISPKTTSKVQPIESTPRRPETVPFLVICISVIVATCAVLALIFSVYCILRRRKAFPTFRTDKDTKSVGWSQLVSDALNHKENSTLQVTAETPLLNAASSSSHINDNAEINDATPGVFNVLFICGGKLSCSDENKIKVINSVSFGNGRPEDDLTVIGINNMKHLGKVTIYQLYCTKEKLDVKQSKKLLNFVQKYQSSLNVVYLPALTLDEELLQVFRNLAKDIVFLCVAYEGTSHETAAESIAIGFVHSDMLHRNVNIAGSGLLDLTVRASSDIVERVDAAYYMLHVIDEVVHLLNVSGGANLPVNIHDSGTKEATKEMRRRLIDRVKLSKRPNHHPDRGFGLISDEERTNGILGEEKRTFALPQKRPVTVAIASTGCDMRWLATGPETWKITALGDESYGDKDTAYHRGTSSMNLFIRALQQCGVNKADVDVSYAVVDTCERATDWDRYSETLKRLKAQKTDVIFLSAGLGRPPSDSGIHKLMHDLQTSSIIITNAISAKVNKISADFPSENVISVRNGRRTSEYPLDSTVDFDVTKNEDLNHICNSSWAGALRITALTTRILLLLFEQNGGIVINDARTTAGMREILKTVCARGYSKEHMPIIKPEMHLSEDVVGRVRTCLEDNTEHCYWAGKEIKKATLE